MEREIWGTFSVKDHCVSNAFVRETLLFDRLVLPVPNSEQERNRWRQPTPDDPTETWDPDRLEQIREILGSQDLPAQSAPDRGWLHRHPLPWIHRHPTKPPASLVWDSPWAQYRCESESSRLQFADTVTNDPFHATRVIVAEGKDLPGVIEAVAAFPSARQCRHALNPAEAAPANPTVAEALIILGTPLLLPKGEEDRGFGPLRDAAELAREPRFQQERLAYYDWMRQFVGPLQQPGQSVDEVKLDAASMKLADEQLHRLVETERQLIGKWDRRRCWTRTELACTVVSVASTAGLALLAPLPVIGAGAAFIGFGGWIAGKRADRDLPADRPLGGGSLFVTAQRQLLWSA